MKPKNKKNNKIKISQKQTINAFTGIDRHRAKKYYENRFTKKDRLLFSNNLIKCKRLLMVYYIKLNEIQECEEKVKEIPLDATSKLILDNYLKDKKELHGQISRYNNFLETFVFKGIDAYFTKEEIRQLLGASKECLDKYYLEHENSPCKGFTSTFIRDYKAEFRQRKGLYDIDSQQPYTTPLYHCIKNKKIGGV